MMQSDPEVGPHHAQPVASPCLAAAHKTILHMRVAVKSGSMIKQEDGN